MIVVALATYMDVSWTGSEETLGRHTALIEIEGAIESEGSGAAAIVITALNKAFSDSGSVAVALPGGLITPIVRQANRKSLSSISQEMLDLVTKAKAGTLKPEEFQGGTFSISNLGMLGVSQFDAIINPPQGAILAIGAGEQRVVAHNGQPAVRTQMTVTLSCDHRVIDGALGALFLKELKRLVQTPSLMML